jgi:hypothetical protein
VSRALPVLEFGFEHSEIVINAPFASVPISFVSAQRVKGELSSSAPEINENASNSFVVHEHTATPLLLMMDFEVIFRQPDGINTMIDDGFPHVTNLETFLAEATCEFYVFGSS